MAILVRIHLIHTKFISMAILVRNWSINVIDL